MTTVTTRGGEDTFEHIVVYGIQPGRVITSQPRPVRTALELQQLIDVAHAKVVALEEAEARNTTVLKTTSRGTEANEAARRERSRLSEQLRVWRHHAGVLDVELRDLSRVRPRPNGDTVTLIETRSR